MIRFVIALSLLFIAGVPTLAEFGPQIEGYLFPVVTTEIVNPRIEAGRLYFHLAGQKNRPCPLDSLPFYFIYDDALEPAAVYETATHEVYSPQTLISHGQFVYRELYVDIPKVAYGLPEVEFGGTSFHNCHALWRIPHHFAIKPMISRAGEGSALTMLVGG